MNTDDRLNLRARQILDDPTLSQNQRLPNAAALLQQLAATVKNHPALLESMLAEISDDTVRAQMADALGAPAAPVIETPIVSVPDAPAQAVAIEPERLKDILSAITDDAERESVSAALQKALSA